MLHRVLFFSCVLSVALVEVSARPTTSTEQAARAILEKNCSACHGAARMSGLDLRQRETLLKGGTRGPALIPGKAEESLLYQAASHSGELKMPPQQDQLSSEDLEILRQWINEGAPWSSAETVHTQSVNSSWWSFRKLQPPPIPTTKNVTWVRNPIDAFILAKLEEKGLPPASQADKRTLIRRATFDLTGLPPTPEDIESFLSDDSSGAFAKVVYRLLASPHYGERWGRHWLDLVRYADLPDAYRYRDWVVNAFNRDMPYDQFIRYQIAGDLIPPEDSKGINAEGIIATGLLVIGEWGAGEADKPKMITDIVDDQIDVVGLAFMGLTTACARCHDHKYDPISTEDYYSLAGIFFSTHIIPDPGSNTHGTKRLRVPLLPKVELDKINRHKERIAQKERQLKAEADQEYRKFAESLVPETARYMMAAWGYKNRPNAEHDLSLAAFAAERKLHPYALQQWLEEFEYRLLKTPIRDIKVRRPRGQKGVLVWSHGTKSEVESFSTPWVGVNSNTLPVGILTEDSMGNTRSSIILWERTVAVFPPATDGVVVGWKSPITGTVTVSGRLRDADNVCGDGIRWTIEHESSARKRSELVSGGFPNGGQQTLEDAAESLPVIEVNPGEMLRLEVKPKANNDCDTTLIEWTISEENGDRVWDLTKDIIDDLHEELTGKGNPHADRLGNSDVWYFFDSGENQAFAKWNRTLQKVASGKLVWSAVEEAAREYQQALECAAVAKQAQQRKSEPTEGLPAGRGACPQDHFPQFYDKLSPRSPFWLNPRDDLKYLPPAGRNHLARLRSELDELKTELNLTIPYALAAQEGGVPKSSHEGIGDVQVHIRGSYKRLGEKVPRSFIRAIAGGNQKPITEGSGRMQLAQWIASPDHPLTSRVMVNRIWQHHFGEGIVRSPNNFGRMGDSPSHPELLDFLATQFVDTGWSLKAIHRLIMLSATYQQSSRPSPEILREDPDNHLFSRMNRRRLESEAIRDALLAVSESLDRTSGGSAYKDIFTPRLTLYLAITRSVGTSFNSQFDAPDAAAVTGKRAVSTVTPQALFILNHPFVLQQARALADRIAKEEPAGTEKSKIHRLYTLLYGRPPQSDEIEIALRLLGQNKETKRSSGAGVANSLTWEEYCHILLAANEFIYVD